MFFSFATFALAALATANAAAVNSTLLSRGIGVHCGTTDDATLSDCQQLLNDDATWNAAWAGQRNVCQYVSPILRYFLGADDTQLDQHWQRHRQR